MNSKDLFEHYIDKALREDPHHFGKSVVMEAFEKTLKQVKNSDLLHSVSKSFNAEDMMRSYEKGYEDCVEGNGMNYPKDIC